MTQEENERRVSCVHWKACNRLVNLRGTYYSDPFYWTMCDLCRFHETVPEFVKRVGRDGVA